MSVNRSEMWEQVSFPQVLTSSASWQTVGVFGFLGSDDLGIPTKIKVIGGVVDPGAVAGMRVYDYTNAQMIASDITITATNPALCDLGALANVPTDPAIWVVQVKRVSGTGGDQVAAGTVAIKW